MLRLGTKSTIPHYVNLFHLMATDLECGREIRINFFLMRSSNKKCNLSDLAIFSPTTKLE